MRWARARDASDGAALRQRADELLAACARFGTTAAAELQRVDLDEARRELLRELVHDVIELEHCGRVALLAVLVPRGRYHA
jgi:hypothetical protein